VSVTSGHQIHFSQQYFFKLSIAVSSDSLFIIANCCSVDKKLEYLLLSVHHDELTILNQSSPQLFLKLIVANTPQSDLSADTNDIFIQKEIANNINTIIFLFLNIKI
jgi:hypothetical protein